MPGLEDALPFTSAGLVIGFSPLQVPFKGGTLVPDLDLLILGLPTGPAGVLEVPFAWPTGLPGGLTTYVQYWIADPGGPQGFSATNGLAGTTP